MSPENQRGVRQRRCFPDLLGIAFVLAAAGLLMAPALAHGRLLGPYDQLSQFGLTSKLHIKIQNDQISDLIREIIPWTTLSWTQVHAGFLPLWNPYGILGAPLAFNWQSATFSIPALVGYLAPVRFDFTLQVLLSLVIGGSGVYVLGRILRLGILGAAMGATVFELNGAFMALLGWPIAATMSWAGWLFGCAILVVRGNHRRRSTVQFAIVLALAIYAGQPDTLVLLAISLAVFLVVLLGFRAGRMGWSDGTLRPGLDLGIGAVAGLGLAAPLAFPAAQLSSGSVRAAGRHNAYPIHDVLHVIFQKFNGWPLGRSKYFDVHGVQYVPTAAYVGVIALVLAVVALCVLRRRPAVIGFGCVGAVMAALVFVSPLVSLLNGLPGFGEIRWVRAIQLVAFALSVLAGAGLNEVVRSHGGRQVRNWMGAGFGSIGVLLIVIWLFGRGNLPRFEASIRARSFIWPAVEVAVGLLVFLYLVAMGRRVHADTGRCRLLTDPGWTAGGVLLLVSTGWLVAIGTPWWPSSNSFLVPTPNVTSLQRAVGNSVVGFGPASCYYTPALGIPPNVNLVYRVHELDYYDPLIPDSLYKSWIRFTGQSPTAVGPLADVSPISMFCPVITTAAQARLFGVTYVLEQRLRKSGPVGSVYVTSIGGERLYRIPDASVATLTRLGAGGRLPSLEATGKPLRVTYPSPNSWKVVTHSATSQVLRLRLTDVPGWHASIDGKPLPLMPFAGAMLQARVPAGTHTIELHYWPDAFNVGIAVAAFSAIGLLLLITVGTRIRHRRPGHAEA